MVAGKCREFNLAILTTADDVFTFLQEIHEKHSPAENDAMQVLLRTIASSKKDETEFGTRFPSWESATSVRYIQTLTSVPVALLSSNTKNNFQKPALKKE